MQGKLTTIHPNGQRESIDLLGPPGLDDLQARVGGMIELIGSFDKFEDTPCIAYCNEEGKLHDLEVNIPATKLWSLAVGRQPGDVLVGDVVILQGDDEFMGAL